jgi:hypothetical protein
VVDGVTIVAAVIAVASIAATVLIALRSRTTLPASKDRINWWLPSFVVVGAGVALLLLMIHSADAPILYSFFIVPVVCFACLLLLLADAIRKRPRQGLSALLALVGFLAISWGLHRNEGTLRPFLRWLLWSRRYKAEVAAAPGPVKGELKHVVWDTWGFVPSGFDVVCLVYDPNDSLATAATSKSAGRFAGIPCEVPRVLRLERQWYAVDFYTDQEWSDCPPYDLRVR